MGKRRTIDIHFPVGGLNKRYAYQSQPPYTTPDCNNVRPFGIYEGRECGGSRPGVDKAFEQLLGSGDEVRMLANLTTSTDLGDNLLNVDDDFVRANSVLIGGDWEQAFVSDIGISGNHAILLTSEVDGYATWNAIDPFETSESYTITMWPVTSTDPTVGKTLTYSVQFRMNNTTPVTDNSGAWFKMVGQMVGASISWTYTLAADSGNETYAGAGPMATPGVTTHVVSVTVSGDNVKAYHNGVQIFNQTLSTSAAGKRVGFTMERSLATDPIKLKYYKVDYYGAAPFGRFTRLMASCGGNLYKEETPGTLISIATSPSIAADRQIMAQERGQKLYIANYGDT